MRKLLLILLVASITANGQPLTAPNYIDWGSSIPVEGLVLGFGKSDYAVRSKYDTTLLFKGEDNCVHHFSKKNVYEGMYSSPGVGCLVYHGPAGCPDKWEHFKAICTICLRHIEVKETRWVEQLKDEYAEALEKLDEYQKSVDKLNKKLKQ